MRILMVIFLMLGALSAYADHRVEVRGSVGFGDFTIEQDNMDVSESDVDTLEFSAKVYLDQIASERGPLSESGFLSKSSHVDLYVSRYSRTRASTVNADRDIDEYSLGGRFVFSSIPVFVGGSLGDQEIDYSDSEALTGNKYRLEFGGYVTDTSALWLERVESRLEFQSIGLKRNHKTTSLKYRHINLLSSRKALVWMLHLEESDAVRVIGSYDRKSLGGSIKFYLNEKMGFGAGVRFDDYQADSVSGLDADLSGAVFSPEFSYDFHENVGMYVNIRSEAVVLDVSNSNNLDSDVSEVVYSVGLTGRF